MMLPSLMPMLWRYRRAIGEAAGARVRWLTLLVAVGYFFVWALFGLVAFSLGVVLATIAMEVPSLAHVVPMTVGVVVVIAGALQFSAWKARHLACCRPNRARLMCFTLMPERHGGTGCAWVSTALTAAPVSQRCFSSLA
jgi:predicted metal-binding membrane protein